MDINEDDLIWEPGMKWEIKNYSMPRNGRFRVVEIYKRGEKVYKGKQYRMGWQVYREVSKGFWILDSFLSEGKNVRNKS